MLRLHSRAVSHPLVESPSETPQVSLCIVTWNAKEALRKCLHSILDDSWGIAYEVMVCDNASEDGTREMLLDEFPLQQFPHLIVLRSEKNLMFGAGANIAAKAARGRVVVILNDDTVVSARAMEGLCQFLEATPAAGLAGPIVARPSGKPERTFNQFPTVQPEGPLRLRQRSKQRISGEQPEEIGWIGGCCIAIKAECGRQIGF